MGNKKKRYTLYGVMCSAILIIFVVGLVIVGVMDDRRIQKEKLSEEFWEFKETYPLIKMRDAGSAGNNYYYLGRNNGELIFKIDMTSHPLPDACIAEVMFGMTRYYRRGQAQIPEAWIYKVVEENRQDACIMVYKRIGSEGDYRFKIYIPVGGCKDGFIPEELAHLEE